MRAAVVGATGEVGRMMTRVLEEQRVFPDELDLFASAKSAGTEVTFNGKKLAVKELTKKSMKAGYDYLLFSAGAAVSREFAPVAAEAGAVVIDNSSLYRYDPAVPLVVPEVNPEAVEMYKNKNIIANPNCSTAQLVVALKPLHDRAKIKRVVVATYQSVSGAGKEGMDELWEQTKAVYNPTSDVPPKK